MTEIRTATADVSRLNLLWRRIRPAAICGFGGFLVIYLLAGLTDRFDWPLLVAPFGASCVLVFALPQSPLARPKNLVFGHLISAFIGLCVLALLGPGPLSLAIAVGLAIAAMQATDTLHPPAGADPIVVLLSGASWSFLVFPILAGTLAIFAVAWVYHRYVSGRPYPV
ncbi:HPP family protein [Shinella sp.]|uniref:HPP family protein n=1 Tax=Shinella sp. TaxID=1870904 RepID=UPI003F6E9234